MSVTIVEYTSTKSNFIATSNKFSLNRKNLLLRQGKLVLKKSEIETVFKQVHQHSGRDITYKKFQSRFWFRGMYVWAQKKVKECIPCSNKNNPQWPAHRTPLIYSNESPNVVESPCRLNRSIARIVLQKQIHCYCSLLI